MLRQKNMRERSQSVESFGLAVVPRKTRTGRIIYICGRVENAAGSEHVWKRAQSGSEDSDPSESAREAELAAYSKLLAVSDPRTSRSNSIESDSSSCSHGNHRKERRCSPMLLTTKSASTSMEDLLPRKPTMIDKWTSIEPIITNGSRTNRTREEDLSEFPEADSFRWGPSSVPPSEPSSNNLTDSVKAKLLHRQLLDLQTQSVTERRKYSDVRRYWVDPTLVENSLGVPVLHRASSSPSVLGADLESESPNGLPSSYPPSFTSTSSAETSNSSTVDNHMRSAQAPKPWRRVSEGAEVIRRRSEHPPEYRHSYHGDELRSVPEGSPTLVDYVDNESRGSSGSESPVSQSPDEDDDSSLRNIPIPSYNADGPTQRSPQSSPPPFTIDVVIDTPTESSSESDSNTSSQVARRPNRRPGLSAGIPTRPGIGHSVSLPAASFSHYLSVLHQSGGARSDSEDVIEEEEEDEAGEPIMPTHRRERRASVDDDEVYVKKNREKRQKKTSVSLRFEGGVPRENAETLAADIAAFLQYRKRSDSDVTEPHQAQLATENAAPSREVEDISMAESAAIARARSLSRRRGSAVVSLPGERSYQMDLHVLNTNRTFLSEKSNLLEKKDLSGSSTSLNSIVDPDKKSRWSILRRNKKLLYGKEKARTVEDFREVLAGLRDSPRPTIDHELGEYKESHWTQLMKSPQGTRRPLSDGVSNLSDQETKRREALWELFHSEVVYLMDHVLVLKEVFLEPLRLVQQMGYLQNVDTNKIFCNVEGLCEVSAKFAADLLLVFKGDQTTSQFGSTAAVVSAFTEFGWRVHPQYQEYCLNYSKVLGYIDHCKQSEDFQEFVKWCEYDPRCNRLQLTDLLVAPLQHLTKYPLLLKNIRKRTSEGDDQHSSLSTVIKSVELSIKELEGKVKSLANLERLQDLQKCLVWPSIVELDPKTYVPEFLRGILAKQPCEGLLTSSNRQLFHEGSLLLHESTKQDIYGFLFDDMLLLTRCRKLQPKAVKKLSLAGMAAVADSPPPTPPVVRKTYANVQYTVYKQPIPLDRFIVIDAEATHAGNTLKNSFIIIHYSRFKQTIGLYTLQAPTQTLKETWTSRLKAAQSSWSEAVAMEIASEAEKVLAAHAHYTASAETPSEESGVQMIDRSPDDKSMNQTRVYHKPIESHC